MGLKLYCSTNPNHFHSMANPWSHGEFTYATNGYIIIRIPRLADVPENDECPKVWEGDLAELFTREPAAWIDVPEVDYEGEECERCDGTKEAYLCPECEGYGEVFLQSRFNVYEGQDCATCNGDGQLPQDEWDAFVKCHSFKGEPIKEVCDGCDGTGIATCRESHDVNGVLINEKYLWMIGNLPGAKLGTFGEPDPVRFTFDGGDGLVMPMRR